MLAQLPTPDLIEYCKPVDIAFPTCTVEFIFDLGNWENNYRKVINGIFNCEKILRESAYGEVCASPYHYKAARETLQRCLETKRQMDLIHSVAILGM